MLRIECRIRGKSPLMAHKFNGKEEEKAIKTLPDREQAERHAYRMIDGDPNSNLAIPDSWLRGCIISQYIDSAPTKSKTKYTKAISSAINVYPQRIDLGVQSFVVDKRSIPVKDRNGKIVDMDFCCRPKLDEWEATFIIETTLPMDKKEFDTLVRNAGEYTGIGSAKNIGYGRFEVLSSKEVK